MEDVWDTGNVDHATECWELLPLPPLSPASMELLAVIVEAERRVMEMCAIPLAAKQAE